MKNSGSKLTDFVIRALWLATIGWLALCNLSAANFVVPWLIDPTNPLRHELIIGLSMSIFFAAPAILAVFSYVIFLNHFTRRIERNIGFSFSLSCVAMAAAPWVFRT